jgi:hypothetical protein
MISVLGAEKTGVGEREINRKRLTYLVMVPAKLIILNSSNVKYYQQGESSESPPQGVLQVESLGKSGGSSNSDGASPKPHQETWRVIGGGVMLGTPTSTQGPLCTLRLSF